MPDTNQKLIRNITNAQTALSLGLFDQILPEHTDRQCLKVVLDTIYLGLVGGKPAQMQERAEQVNTLLMTRKIQDIVDQATALTLPH